jgi:hypothetical protein
MDFIIALERLELLEKLQFLLQGQCKNCGATAEVGVVHLVLVNGSSFTFSGQASGEALERLVDALVEGGELAAVFGVPACRRCADRWVDRLKMEFFR